MENLTESVLKMKVNKRIPGEIPTPSKKEKQGFIENLENLQLFELNDLLERQNKLLSNKSFVSKLPDKGEKIKGFREKIMKEIDHRNEMEKAASLLSKLNIAKDGKSAMNQLEWTGKYSETETVEKLVELDSEDEEDPLKILAQPTGSGVHKKKIIHLQKEENLIKPEDLERIKSFHSADSSELEYAKHIIVLCENPEKEERTKFMPYKTTKSNVHDPMKEKVRKKGKNWEVTAATPPLIVHGAVKCLSINESLQLEKDQADKLTVIRMKHAAERLSEQYRSHKIGPAPTNVGSYRTKENSDSDSAASEDEYEVYDEEAVDKERAVVYSVHEFD